MKQALVILSGGQDSTTCLYWAKQKFDKVSAITFDYNQRHSIEIESARKIAEMAGVEHTIVKVPDCLLTTSPLVADTELEQWEFGKAETGEQRSTFVPMRNALFLTIAANHAEAKGIKNLVTGVCQTDTTGYDDCRRVFIDATEDYINTALGHDHRGTGAIAIHTPLMHLNKAETVDLAYGLEGCWEALAYSHTGYDGKFPPTDCNHANVKRAEGFAEAGKPDPLVVRAWKEGLMDLPETSNYNEYR